MHVTVDELYHSLHSNVVGNSSNLFIWDPRTDDFILKGRSDGSAGILTVGPLDEETVNRYVIGVEVPEFVSDIASQSYTSRCLTVGQMIRRIQSFILSIRAA